MIIKKYKCKLWLKALRIKMFNMKKQKYPDQGIRPEIHKLHIQYRKKITKKE